MTAPARSAADSARAAARRMTLLTVGASLFSLLFILSYGYALHAPSPHGVRVDVVATTTPEAAAIGADLDRARPGAFDVHAGSDAARAVRDVRDGASYGALIVPAAGAADVLTASASGLSARQLVGDALRAAAAARGRPSAATDLAPLPAGDRAGQSCFVYELGLLIPGVIGSVGFYLLGRRVRLWVRVAAAAGYAALASALGVLVLDAGFGALTGSPWTLLATGTLVAAAVVLTVAALHALLGLPGTAVAAGILLVVGNAANGSTVPVPLLPDGYRQVAPWLPNGAAVHAFRADVYFSGHGQGQPMLALALWVGVALAVIAGVDLLHLRHRRVRPASHEQIHATSVLAHVRSRGSAA